MTTAPHSPSLVDAVEQPHDHALATIEDDRTSSLVAVAWAATHLAAVERVLYPVAARVLPDGRRRVRTQLSWDRRLHKALWRLDRRLTGDVHSALEPVDLLEQDVLDALQQHAAAERSLVTELEQLLDADARRELLQRLDDAVEQAPTRPHPDTPHTRLTDGLLFRLDALGDRWRDLMDNRPVPTPRRRRPALRPGRWGSYLMAAPYPVEPAGSEVTPSEPESEREQG